MKVIIICGLPGSGKSYLAEKLAFKLQAVYISSDKIRKEMFAVRTYSEAERLAVYKQMGCRMEQAMKVGCHVVLDATFSRAAIRHGFIELAKREGYTFYLIEVVADRELVKNRLTKKRKDSDADLSVYEQIRTRWEALDEPHLVLLSGDDNADLLLYKILNYIHE